MDELKAEVLITRDTVSAEINSDLVKLRHEQSERESQILQLTGERRNVSNPVLASVCMTAYTSVCC